MKLYSKYFYGNEVSAYGQEHNRLDYATLAKAFDAVLANNIISDTSEIGYWEQESGFADNSEEIDELQEELESLQDELDELDDENGERRIDEIETRIEEIESEIYELENEENDDEIMQYFIVSSQGAEILEEINEIVFYNDTLDLYVWGVTHWGTSWDYVLTDVEINAGEEAFEQI